MRETSRRMAALVLTLIAVAAPAPAQRKGDYLTDKELDLVREAQDIDQRASVFIAIADRRLLAITDPNAKLSKKDLESFGPLPTGTQVELLDDYRRALDEFMDKVDDAFRRSGKSQQFMKAAKLIHEGVARQLSQLGTLRAGLKDPDAIHYR